MWFPVVHCDTKHLGWLDIHTYKHEEMSFGPAVALAQQQSAPNAVPTNLKLELNNDYRTDDKVGLFNI